VTEFLVIVLAVSLSFLAEDVRENRREQASGIAALQRVLVELESDDFDTQNRRYARALRGMERLFAARGSTSPADSVGAWLTDAAACSEIVVSSAEYESIKSSGLLEQIPYPDLRLQLIAHYERYPAVIRIAAADCDFSYMRPLATHVAAELNFQFPEYVVTGDVGAILSNDEFFLELGHARQRKRLLERRFEILTEQRAELLEGLRAIGSDR
jgi:hypothetical protein